MSGNHGGGYRKKFFEHHDGYFGFYICTSCGKPLTKDKVEVDHIIPVSKFKINHWINLTSMCLKCNRSKSDKLGLFTVKIFLIKALDDIILTFKKGIKGITKTLLGKFDNNLTGRNIMLGVIGILGLIIYFIWR